MSNMETALPRLISKSIASDKKYSELLVFWFPAFMLVVFFAKTPKQTMALGFLVVLFAICTVIFVQYELTLRLADEVTATETHLVVIKDSEKVLVRYDNIQSISFASHPRMMQRITLQLINKTAIGSRIGFRPEEEFALAWAGHPVTNNLLILLNRHGA